MHDSTCLRKGLGPGPPLLRAVPAKIRSYLMLTVRPIPSQLAQPSSSSRPPVPRTDPDETWFARTLRDSVRGRRKSPRILGKRICPIRAILADGEPPKPTTRMAQDWTALPVPRPAALHTTCFRARSSGSRAPPNPCCAYLADASAAEVLRVPPTESIPFRRLHGRRARRASEPAPRTASNPPTGPGRTTPVRIHTSGERLEMPLS